jgi:hypothetical protein
MQTQMKGVQQLPLCGAVEFESPTAATAEQRQLPSQESASLLTHSHFLWSLCYSVEAVLGGSLNF